MPGYVNDGIDEGTRLGLQGQLINIWPLVEKMYLGTPRRILDAGCGAGRDTLELSIRFPDSDVVGVDVSERRINDALALIEAERKSSAENRRILFRVETLEDIAPNVDNRYDLILVKFVLQYQKQPHLILGKIRDLLTDEGSILICDTDGSIHSRFAFPDDESLDDYRAFLRLVEEDYWDPVVGRKLFTLLVNNGFDVEEIVIKPYYLAGTKSNYDTGEARNMFLENWAIRFDNIISTRRDAVERRFGTIDQARQRVLEPLTAWFKRPDAFSYFSLFLVLASK